MRRCARKGGEMAFRKPLTCSALTILLFAVPLVSAAERPNILLMISDDQSWPHASAYGDSTCRTPNFDAVAKSGVLFTNAFCASPGCSPSRAALLTGMNTWQIREAGTHASGFPLELKTFPERLAEAGYATGFCGKGWGPGKFHVAGRKANPAGPKFAAGKKPDGSANHSGAFRKFLEQRKENQS
ncbi:MAG: sulfatase-like hydrolase/transferase, partial [Planctomycetota bacterium]